MLIVTTGMEKFEAYFSDVLSQGSYIVGSWERKSIPQDFLGYIFDSTSLTYYGKLDVGQKCYIYNLTEATYDVNRVKTYDLGSFASGILAYSLTFLSAETPGLSFVGSALILSMSFDTYLVEKESFVINAWIKNCGDGTLLDGTTEPGCENVPEETYYVVTLLKWRKDPPWFWEEPYYYSIPVMYIECR